ncbi:hypothetical protein IV203_014095 [Nitzschia inconspicua]|uniref:Uncharacterized protein n=1 Tax=Nitzschia inconspicua TaxID=303405 RepID=A0A9K3M7W5_9STRA|nr:hypothetical protein IV203_014095 [Nitzschia inconspicua]
MSSTEAPTLVYVAPTYQPPEIFVFVTGILEKTTGSSDTSLLSFINGTREEQVQYVRNLLGIGIFFICIVCVWFLILLVLKFSGQDRMGCAAGYPFHSNTSAATNSRTDYNDDYDDDNSDSVIRDEDDDYNHRHHHRKSSSNSNTDKKQQSSFFGSFFGGGGGGRNSNNNSSGSNRNGDTKKLSHTSSSTPKKAMPDVDYNSHGSPMFDNDESYMEPEPPFQIPGTRNSYDRNNNISSSSNKNNQVHYYNDRQRNYYDHQPNVLYSIPKNNNNNNNNNNNKSGNSNSSSSSSGSMRQTCCSGNPKQVAARKFRTRFFYGLFALISLICCALLMTQMYYPLEDSATTTAQVVQDSQQVVSEIDAILTVLRDTATVVQSIYDSTPLNYQRLCPNFSVDNFATAFGFDPQSVIDTIATEYSSHINGAVDLINDAQAISDTVDRILSDVDTSLQSTEDYLWIVPLLICFSMLVTFALVGLMCAVAYKEYTTHGGNSTEKAPRIENLFGWTFLPLQIIVVIVAWGLVIAFCFGTSVTTDTCIPTIATTPTDPAIVGTPEQTVLAVLSTYTADSVDDSIVQRLEAYIDGCRGEDPLAEVNTLKALLDESLAFVDSRITLISSIGVENMEAVCGDGNQIRLFFDNIQLLQGQFEQVDGILTDVQTALACPRLNALYIRAMHQALCSEFATANAAGFVLFLIVSVCGMVLISLRAAWRSSNV